MFFFFLFSLFFTLIHVHHQPYPERSASACNSFSKYLFFCFLFTLIRAHHLCSYHHPRPHTTHLHATPSAYKTICTQHIPVCMLPFQVSFFFFSSLFFALIGIGTQRICVCMHPFGVIFFFFFLLFFFALIGIHTSTRNTSTRSKFVFSFFFLYAHPHPHTNTSVRTCPSTQLHSPPAG